jgi:signal transduction histidine kinase/ActR/RegA family two-component response regulator
MIGLEHHTPLTGFDGLIGLLQPVESAAFHAARDRALDPTGDGRLSCQISPEIAGESRTIQLLAQVRFDGSGKDRRPARLVGVLIDQTESRKLAAALSRAQRLDTVGRLAGVIAHDFNNLLSVILANLELGRMRVLDPQTGDLLDRAIEAALMGATFNKRLLALVGGRPTSPVAVDVNARLAEIWQILVRALGEDISVRLETWPHLPLIQVDPSELDGAILNLVVNARDAMPQGGKVTIATALIHIDAQSATTIRGGRSGDFVRISVTDSGIGMPPEVASRAFEPFFTTKGSANGTGLGLTSVDSMASRANGFAVIETTLGEGTTVAVCLPPTSDLPTDHGEVLHHTPFGDGELVLVVEDNPQVREAVLQRLEVLGYAVLEAANADEALAMIEAGEPIRLVFTDVVMPGHLSGFDLVERIRAEHPGIAVVLKSGHVSSRFTDQHARLPDVEFLAKPYLLDTLAEALRRALTARSAPEAPS